ncbi:ATP-binding protein [Streptomyces daliensis]
MPLATLGEMNQHCTAQFPSTRKGAHRARLVAVAQLCAWGVPVEATEGAASVVAELGANAVTHGHVPGRRFRLELFLRCDGVLRVEVADARGEARPPRSGGLRAVAEDAESGRGLLLVEALALRWGVAPGPFPCKTVWAEVVLGEAAGPGG